MSLFQRRLIILAIGGIVVLYAVKQTFAINTVIVKSPQRTTEIQAEAVKQLSSNFRQGNMLTFDSQDLTTKLRDADPIIKTIEVHRKWPHAVTLAVTLKQPSIGWSSGNQSFLLDREGGVIATLPPKSTFPVVIDGSNLPVTIGARVTSVRFVEFVSGLQAALPSTGIGITQLEIKDTTLDLYVTTDKGYRLMLDTSRSVGEAITDLRAVLNTLALQKKTPAEYIDLRVAGKAYYK